MAYENIRITHPNFCLGPQSGSFCYVDSSGSSAIMRVKNSSGSLIRTFDFYPSNNLNVDSQATTYPYRKLESIKYVGPVNQSGFYDGMPFYTLERQVEDNKNTSTSCFVKMWAVNTSQSRLELKKSFSKVSSIDDHFDCSAMVINTIKTKFIDNVSTRTGEISIENTTGLNKYDLLMLGPSNDVTNLNAIEYCYVHSVSGTNVKIRTFDPLWPTTYEYLTNDSVTVIKHAYLFSTGNDNYNSALYKLSLDEYTPGTVLHKEERGIFGGITAADWDSYFSGVAFVKELNLLTISVDDYEVFKSHTLKNTTDAEKCVVYEIAFNGTSIYRLQDRLILWDNAGVYASTIWTTYNYLEDTVMPYSTSIAVYIKPSGYVFRQQSFYVYVKVKDQYGVALSNKNINFYNQGDSGAYFIPTNGAGVTDINGEFSVEYRAGSSYDGIIKLSARSDGSSMHLGSSYVWVVIYGYSLASLSKSFEIYQCTSSGIFNINQNIPPTSLLEIKGKSKFSFPGGEWTNQDYVIPNMPILQQALIPTQNAETIVGGNIAKIPSNVSVIQNTNINNSGYVNQIDKRVDTIPVDQTYISRHYLYGNSDSTTTNQFVFVQEARPVFWSEKNPVSSDIWLRLRPFATSLDPNTFKIQIKENSYAGEEMWHDITSEGTVNIFNAGGGMYGIEFQWYPSTYFHNNGVVYVKFEVYDMALVPNKITTEYWFIIIPDYKTPYIENIFPHREAYDVKINTNISFDLLDLNTGVDIESLEMYVNYKQVHPTYSGIESGYHIEYSPEEDFNYKDTVLISIKVNDISAQHNRLLDSWRFYCIESNAPWVNNDEMRPGRCVIGKDRKYSKVELQIYGDMNGVDGESIELYVGGPKREPLITPIVYRLN